MAAKRVSTYDKEELYKKEILPLVSQINVICNKNKIPFMMNFAVGNSAKGTEYRPTALMPEDAHLKITDDKLRLMVMGMNGFELAMNRCDEFETGDENSEFF